MLGIECLLLIPFTMKYRSLNREERLIYLYVIASVIYAGGSYILSRIVQNNWWFNTIMNLTQIIILSMFYLQVLKKSPVRKLVMPVLAVVIVIYLLDITLLEGYKVANSISQTTRNVILIIYGVTFFLQLLRNEELREQSIYINSLPTFWFNAGLFIYICSSFMMYLFFSFLQNANLNMAGDKSLRAAYQITRSLNFTAGIIQFVLFYVGLRKIKRTER